MDPITQQTVLAAAGAAGEEKVYVDDVFSTYLYDGNDANGRDIPNGIDLDGEGGMVWIKRRNGDHFHCLFDTERGVDSLLHSNTVDIADTSGGGITAFNSDGFTIDNTSSPHINDLNDTFASWSFRKAPGFFDVVTYSGNSTAGRTVSHSLGSVPGMIIIKILNSDKDWHVYHRSLGATKNLRLNETDAARTQTVVFNDTEPTSTHFTLGSEADVNGTGNNFVAYIFAHDDASFGTDGDQSIIKCGTYSGNGSNTGPTINLGFEPQWIMIKSTGSNSGPWMLFDTMRGIISDDSDPYLTAETSSGEGSFPFLNLTATGFDIKTNFYMVNASGIGYIYMAIRRPNKPPELATDVFAIDTGNSSSTIPCWDSGFPVDFAMWAKPDYTYHRGMGARLLGTKYLKSNDSLVEANDPDLTWDSNVGWGKAYASTFYSYMFKRAPGFFDVVAYDGIGSVTNQNHNLGVVPELMLVKCRNNTNESWKIYSAALGTTKVLNLNNTSEATTSSTHWNTAPTSSVFTVGTNDGVNKSGNTYLNYLFATLPGISKVGSYAGTGNPINIDCGFTNGARFVLIKRSNGSGNWLLFDTTRGINAGSNDPFLALNSSADQDDGYNIVEPYSSGFSVTTSAFVNDSDKEFIFLAIA